MRITLCSLALAAAVAAAPPPGEAQKVTAEHLFRPGSIALSVYGGGAAFSPFERSSVRMVGGTSEYERRVSAHTSMAVGAELMWWLSPSWGLRLHGSLLPSRFDVQHDAAANTPLLAGGTADSTDWRALNVWLADVSALIRPPFTFGRMAPYAVVGGGLVSYRPRGSGELPPSLESSFGEGARTSLAAVVGLGAAVPLQRENLILSFAVTNHLTRTPVRETASAFGSDAAAGSLLPAEIAAERKDAVAITNNVRLMVGLTVPLRTR